MSNRKRYPFHPSLNYVLASVNSPLYAMRLIRTIAFNLDVSTDQVEILIGLAGHKDPVYFPDICAFVPHMNSRKVKTALRKLTSIKAVIIHDVDVEDYYFISPVLAARIKELDKESLQSPIH